jgi:hypothetical protein
MPDLDDVSDILPKPQSGRYRVNSPAWMFSTCCVFILGGFCLLCCLPTVAVTVFGAVILNSEVSRTETQTFRLEPNETFSLVSNLPNTDVIINTSPEGQNVAIEAIIRAYGLEENSAQRLLDGLSLDVQREAGGPFIIGLNNEFSGFFNIYDLTLTLTVPRQAGTLSLVDVDSVEINGLEADEVSIEARANVNINDSAGVFNITTAPFGEINFNGRLKNGTNRLTSETGNINFIGEIGNDGTSTFTSEAGAINANILGRPSVRYSVVSTTGTTTCPRNQCEGRLGDASMILNLRSESGNITLITP